MLAFSATDGWTKGHQTAPSGRSFSLAARIAPKRRTNRGEASYDRVYERCFLSTPRGEASAPAAVVAGRQGPVEPGHRRRRRLAVRPRPVPARVVRAAPAAALAGRLGPPLPGGPGAVGALLAAPAAAPP